MSRLSEPVRVLHVDDDAAFLELTAEFLERESDVIVPTPAPDVDEGLDALARDPFDCVVSDYDMPGPDGIEFLERVRERYPDLPFVLFTGKGSEEIASEAISAGVTDYLQKGGGRERFSLLANRVEKAVERYRSERALEEHNRRLETLISNLPGIVYRCANAPGWPMSYVAGECEELVGYPADAIERGEVSWGEDILHPDDREEAWETVQTAIEDDEPFELTYRVVDADGDVRWVWERGRAVTGSGEHWPTAGDGSGATAARGDSTSLEGFITDITGRRERERELHEQREFTETVMNAFDDIVYVFDAEGNYIRWNDRATEVSGYTEAELAELGPADFVADEHVDRIADSIEEIFETGRSAVEGDLVMADGTRVPYEFRGRALTDDEGEPWGFCGIARDISERRRRERELEARNERLDEFASIVSHDLRNPLNVAQGHLEQVREECDSEHLDPVADAHGRMEALIEELLTLGREGEAVTDPDTVELAVVVEQGWRHVDTPNASLVVETERTIRADRARLQRLVENLVRNAVEHGRDPDGRDDDTPEDPPHLTVTAGDLPDGSGFYVADDGVGIPPEERERVLGPESTTDDGTGFGLAIVQRLATAHDWTLALTESAAGGTRIEIRGVEDA
jgi:PAS domain S-box-containing protein